MGRQSKGMLFKRNGWWYYKRIEGGKTFCRSCKTRNKAEAEKAAAEFRIGSGLPREARLAAIQEFLKPKSEDPSLAAAFERFAKHPKNIGMKEETLSALRGHWSALTRWLQGQHKPGSRLNCNAAHPEVKKVGQVTQRIAEEFVSWAKGTTSPNTVNKYIATFRRVWRAVDASENPWDAFAKLSQPPRQRRALTREETDRLLDTARGELKTIFALGAFTGLRLSDCAAVKWEDFTSDLKVLRIKPHKTKDSSGVLVSLPVHHRLREILEAIGGDRQGPLSPNYAAAPRWRLSDDVMAVFKASGLAESAKCAGYRKSTPIVGFHSLRATFVTALCEAGAPLALVQSIVGHVSAEITQMYYRGDTERARTYLEKI